MKRIILLLIFSIPVSGQTGKGFLKNWNTYPVPEDVMEYRHVERDWTVYPDGNEIRVDSNRSYKQNLADKKLPVRIKRARPTDAIQVNDGYLLGFNRGEWGGNIDWYSKNGKKKYEIATSINPVQFIVRNNVLYAITGINHLSITEGNIIKIEKEGDKWTVKEYLKLPDKPHAVQLDSHDNMLVFTSSGLYSIDNEANIDTLAVKFSRPTIPVIEVSLPGSVDTIRVMQTPMYRNPKWVWGFLHPTSMVIQNDVVYVGMRGGVYKFDLATKKEEWLLPE